MGPLSCPTEFTNAIQYLDSYIGKERKFLVGNSISVADYVVVGALYTNGYWKSLMDSKKASANLVAWFNQMNSLPEVKTCVDKIPAEGKPKAERMRETTFHRKIFTKLQNYG